MKVLITVNCHRTLLNNTGTDAIGAFTGFTPDSTRPQTPLMKHIIIGNSTTPFDRNTLTVGQQNTATDTADRLKQTIQHRLCQMGQRFNMLLHFP
jgi:hypothetical protein